MDKSVPSTPCSLAVYSASGAGRTAVASPMVECISGISIVYKYIYYVYSSSKQYLYTEVYKTTLQSQ